MTELLFFSASVIGVFLLFFYLTQRKWYLLVLSAVFLGFASLTRLTGMDTIITALMALLILGRVAWRQKIKDSLIMGLISISPSIIWLLYTYSVTHNLAARSFSSPGKLWAATFPLRSSFMEVLWRWLPFQKLFPTYTYQILRNVAVVFCILFFILVGWVIYRRVRVHNTISVSTRLLDFALFWIVFSIGNIAFLVVSFTFTNLQPDLNERIYLPVQIGLVLMILTLIAYGIRESSRPLATGWICAVLALILLYPNGQKSWKIIQQYHQTGLGYTGAVWHSSLTLESLRGIPDIVPIITNEAAAVLLLLNRPAYDFCTLPCDPSKPFGYGNDPQDPIQRVFRVEQAALVLFYPLCGDLQDPTYAKFMGQLATLTKDLVRYFYSCDGVIYFYP